MSLYKGTNLISGHQVLYSTTGNNTDGAMTQKATTNLTKLMNVLLMGNVTVSDYVLSGFNQNNYAKFPANFQPSSNTWEMVFKVTTGNDLSGEQVIVSMAKSTINTERFALRTNIYDGNFVILSTYNGTTWDISSTGTYAVLANTTYYVKTEYTGSAYILSYSLDGETYTEDINITSSTPTYNNFGECLIGAWNVATSSNVSWTGSIDLKESYIKIGNSIWWNGVDYIKDINDFKNGNIFNKSIDGQWVKKALGIGTNVNIGTTNHVYDLSSYLPNDGYNYEVLFGGNCVTGTTNGNALELQIITDVLNTNWIALCGARTRVANANFFGSGNAIAPVGAGRTVTVRGNSSWASTFSIAALAYRRIGTNS